MFFYNGIVSGQSSDYNPCVGVDTWLLAPYPDCTTYVYCYNDQPYDGYSYPFSCAPDFLFNFLLQYCDWPANVDSVCNVP